MDPNAQPFDPAQAPFDPAVPAAQPTAGPRPPAAPAPVPIYNFGKQLHKPDTYDGKDRNACSTFLTQCRLYILGNSALFPDDASKALFVATYLRGKAFAWVEPKLNENDPILSNFVLFCQELLANLGEPEREKLMARKLRALKQTGSCANYRTEFDNITQYLKWDDESLKDRFEQGLKSEIKDVLATVLDEPATLKLYQDLCIRIDNRLYNRKVDSKDKSSGDKPKTSDKPSSNNQRQSSTTPRTSSTTTRTTTSTNGPQPMDLDAARTRRFKPLDEAEKRRRRDNNLCLYCGGGPDPNHRANNCPMKQNRPTRLNATLTPAPENSDSPSQSKN